MPIGTMLPMPMKNRMAQDSQNQGDQARQNRETPKREDAAEQQPVLAPEISQGGENKGAEQRADTGAAH